MKELDKYHILVYYNQDGEASELIGAEGSIWASLKVISKLFNISEKEISEKLNKLFTDSKINKDESVAKFNNGRVDVYSLEVILEIGNHFNKTKSDHFKKWIVYKDERLESLKSILETIKVNASKKLVKLSEFNKKLKMALAFNPKNSKKK